MGLPCNAALRALPWFMGALAIGVFLCAFERSTRSPLFQRISSSRRPTKTTRPADFSESKSRGPTPTTRPSDFSKPKSRDPTKTTRPSDFSKSKSQRPTEGRKPCPRNATQPSNFSKLNFDELMMVSNATRASDFYPSAGCPFSNFDFILFTGAGHLRMFNILLKSIVILVPCYRWLHIVTLPGEAAAIEQNITPSVARVKVHEEMQPPCVLKLSMHERKQWGNYWFDNYTTGSDFSIMIDSDVVLARPLSWDALFDGRNRSYYFWSHRAGSPYRPIRNRPRFPEDAYSWVGNGMLFFPVVFRTTQFDWIRQEMMRRFWKDARRAKTPDPGYFDAMFCTWAREPPRWTGQFSLWLNMLAKLTDEIHPVEVKDADKFPILSHIDSKLQAEDAYRIPSAAIHLAHLNSDVSRKSLCLPGYRKNSDSYEEAAAQIVHFLVLDGVPLV